jgi:site-specific DNA-adenine methylase
MDAIWEASDLPSRPFPFWFEPFFGGGGSYFWAQQKGYGRYGRWVADTGATRTLYEAIQRDPEAVVRGVVSLPIVVDVPLFLEIRARPVLDLLPHEVIYLSKAGYNGLWRVNTKGYNNVTPAPAGSPVALPSAEDIRRTSHQLRGVRFFPSADILLDAASALQADGTICYCDVPYLTAGGKNTVAYGGHWTPSDTEALLARLARMPFPSLVSADAAYPYTVPEGVREVYLSAPQHFKRHLVGPTMTERLYVVNEHPH